MVDELLKKYCLISDQIDTNELRIILSKLELVIANNVDGDVIEMGCYTGTTSLFITRLLNQLESDKKFHVYDSFEGLPEKSQKDFSPAGTQFTKGQLSASKKNFINNFKKTSLPLPIIHKKWFSDLDSNELPDKIAFAFLDGDYYDSIKTSLEIISAKLRIGAIIVVDDYINESLPGAKKAVDEWITRNKYKLTVVHSLAVIEITKH